MRIKHILNLLLVILSINAFGQKPSSSFIGTWRILELHSDELGPEDSVSVEEMLDKVRLTFNKDSGLVNLLLPADKALWYLKGDKLVLCTMVDEFGEEVESCEHVKFEFIEEDKIRIFEGRESMLLKRE